MTVFSLHPLVSKNQIPNVSRRDEMAWFELFLTKIVGIWCLVFGHQLMQWKWLYEHWNMIPLKIWPHCALDLSARRRDINWHWEWSKITPLGRKKFMIVESPPCFTQKPLLTTCHWQVILSDARQTPLNTPYMFISLERLVTKNQLLHTKCQPNIFIVITIWKEKRTDWHFFARETTTKKPMLAFGV